MCVLRVLGIDGEEKLCIERLKGNGESRLF